MQSVVEAAPQLIDYLGEASLSHFNAVRAVLDANGVAYRINPRLVRGMDYYNLTVFEFVTERLGSQGTICGGGRYDYLIGQIGGKPAPAVGWALGVERVMELLKEEGVLPAAEVPDAYVIVPDASALPQVFQTWLWPRFAPGLPAYNLPLPTLNRSASTHGFSSRPRRTRTDR